MKYSFYRVAITPQRSIRMAGYGTRVLPSIGIYDSLYASSLMLDDGKKKVLFISLDLGGVDREFVYMVKGAIKKKHGLNAEDIIVHSIHTHAGPMTGTGRGMSNIKPGTDEYNVIEKYRKSLIENTVMCADECLSAAPKEGAIEVGTGETYIGMNRRQKTTQGVKLGPNPDGVTDRQAFALAIKDSKGKIDVIVYNCSCHPVVLYPRNRMISADFPGAARTALEKKFPGASAMFLQGACGDINPNVLVGGDTTYRDTFYHDVILTGDILANDINSIIRKGMKKVALSLKTRLEKIVLPLAGELNEDCKPQEPGFIPGEVWATYIKLSDDVRIVGLEAEICNEVGTHIRELFPKGNTIVLGYTNSSVGYIPTAQIQREGGHETRGPRYGGPYALEAEDVLLAKIKEQSKGIF